MTIAKRDVTISSNIIQIELNVFMKSLINYFLVVSDVVVVGPERLILKPGLWFLTLMWTGTLLVRSKGVNYMFQTRCFSI